MKLWVDGSTTMTCHALETGETVLTSLELVVPVNEGEYRAMIVALEDCLARKLRELDVFSDSEVVVKQLKGIYKCRAANLKPLRKEIFRLASQFERISFTWVPREENYAGIVLEKVKGRKR